MNYTIQNIKKKTFEDKQTRKQVTLPGFAFIDQIGSCFIIVYGESRRDSMSESLGI